MGERERENESDRQKENRSYNDEPNDCLLLSLTHDHLRGLAVLITSVLFGPGPTAVTALIFTSYD